MRLHSKIQLSLTLPAVLLLAAASAAAYFYLNHLMTEQAEQKGLLVVQMVRTAMLSNVSSEGHSMNSASMMQQFRTMPGLLELRMIRGPAVSNQFGPSHSGSEPVDGSETSMLRSGNRSQLIKMENGREVLHFNGPLKAKNYQGNNCLQCHHVPNGSVLGGFSVQVDLTDELREARILPMYAFLLIGFGGLLIAYALQRFFSPIRHTAMQIADTMQRGERGDFTHRLHDIRTDTDEVRQIFESSNAFFSTLELHIGGIAHEIEMITGHLPDDTHGNMIARARHGVDLMLFSNRLKRSLEEDRNLEEAFIRLAHVLQEDFRLQHFGIFESGAEPGRESARECGGMRTVIQVGLPGDWLHSDAQHSDELAACPPEVNGHIPDGHIVDVAIHPDACCRTCGQVNKDEALHHFCIPIMDSDETRTVITILYSKSEAKQMNDVLARLRYVLRVITPELRSKRLLKILREISIRDPLTGMFNRRFLDEIKPGLVASVKRRNTSLGVLVCDIDLFKQVNDTYGHETGDLVLKGIADIYRKEMRDSDYVIRLGGEEILVLLMDADREKSTEIAERLRAKVGRKTFKVNNCILSKTVSIGVAIFPDDSSSLMDTIQCADLAVYQAKHQGRNQVVCFQSTDGEHIPVPLDLPS